VTEMISFGAGGDRQGPPGEREYQRAPEGKTQRMGGSRLMDVYLHTRDFDRRGCIVGAKFVTYATLKQWYVCRECGGVPVHHIERIDGVTRDWAECADCGTRDFIPQWLYDQQCREYYLILDNLPDELAALFPESEPLDIGADEAIADLYEL